MRSGPCCSPPASSCSQAAGSWRDTAARSRTAARPDGSVPLQPDGSRSDEGGRPDSLLEGEIIDLNTAAPEDLERLPGIGPAKAEAIAAYRTEHGPFRTVDQLMEVSGIGEATLEALRPYITASAPG